MDPYAILGVPRDADLSALRRAYHRRALHCHPDVGGSTEQMRRLTDAYSAAVRSARLGAHPTGPAPARDRGRDPAPSPRDSMQPRARAGELRHWLRVWTAERRSGQWALALLVLATIHLLATLAGPSGGPPSLLELLAMGLAVRVQAFITPRGCTFAPVEDTLTFGQLAFRVLAWLVKAR